jgi:PKD repeat protein
MRKIIFLGLLLFTAAQPLPKEQDSREVYKDFLADHLYNNRPRLSAEDWKSVPKRDRPDLAWEQNYLATMDPVLGRPAPERLQAAYQLVDQVKNQILPGIPGSASSPWVERGPNNVGGRTRAIMWDPTVASGNKVWAGGVTGGLWYNNNITSSSSAWVSVGDHWDNTSITAIAYDPNNTQTFYVGTGEGWGAGATRGAGIWKSTNGGSTWTQLSSTSGYHYINDLVVRDENGSSVVYAASRRNFFRGQWHGVNGLYRSVNGGTSWSQTLPNAPGSSTAYAAADLAIAADDRLWVGTQHNSSGSGGGRVLYSDNGTTWTLSHTVTNGERVALATAPSNSNYVYALTEVAGQAGEIARTTNKGSSWSTRNEPADADNGIPNTDFTRGQGWYDLVIAVDPNSPNTVLVGGIDLFRSTNGASSWSQISKWSNNNNLSGLSCSFVHADQHNITFKPGSSSTILFGNDGGVFYSSSIATAATSNVISARNKDYNITQFYAAALHPTAGSNYALAGAQDNGTQAFSQAGFASTTEATGGDGAYCFIDQTSASYQITSYVYNNFWRSTNGGLTWGSRFQNDNSTGRFINPADYDDNQNILYSTRTSSTINRVSGITTSPSIGSISISGMSSYASHLRVSPFTTTSTTLFVGTEGGDLFKVTNANGSPSSSNIGSSSFPNGNISCVELGANEDEILVTFSNYGVSSIWYTSNGGTSWQNKEGNLPDMPVRWALFNPNDRTEVILATEVGIWSSSNFNNSNPSWNASNSGLARVRVDMLQIRDSDKEVIAATHGRGLFSSSAFNIPLTPVADFSISPAVACLNQVITLSDSSTSNPTSWSWSVSPNTFNFINGTSASSQNPEILMTANGTYDITLIATNANGSDTITKIGALLSGGLPLPFIEDFEGPTAFTVDNPDAGITWSLYQISGNSPGTTAAGIDFFAYSTAPAGQRDGLISPPLDFSGYTSIDLDFDYAYARYDASFRDSMAIFVSIDCGLTYQRVASYTSDPIANFATTTDQTNSFSPSVASDWCGNTIIPNCPSIDLSSFAGQSEVRIKFEGINGYGNNLYLDNINVSGVQNLNIPAANFAANDSNVCAPSTVTFTDLSTNTPTAWAWTVTPAGYTFTGGTSSSSQNPQISFNNAGSYSVSLLATNSFGADTESKTAFISVNATVSPSVQISTVNATLCAGSMASFNATATNGGSNPSYQWKVNGGNVGSNSNFYSSSNLANNDQVTVELSSNVACASTNLATSNALTMTVRALPVISTMTPPFAPLCQNDSLPLTATVNNHGINGILTNWSGPGVVNNIFYASVAGAGTHLVTVGYLYGSQPDCPVNASMQISVDPLTTPTISRMGLNLSCNQTGVTYLWLLNGAPAPGTNNQQNYNLQINGSYTVEITSGICNLESNPIDVIDMSIENFKAEWQWQVYPNPSSNLVQIGLLNPGASHMEIRLYDARGSLVLNSTRSLNGLDIMEPISIGHLADGVYHLRVDIGDLQFHEQLKKQ